MSSRRNVAYHQAPGRHVVNSTNHAVITAFQLAARYPHKLPTYEDLQNAYGMSRATAYRWIASMRVARGLPPQEKAPKAQPA